jgi:flagellar L-ring protein precursor FlgH
MKTLLSYRSSTLSFVIALLLSEGVAAGTARPAQLDSSKPVRLGGRLAPGSGARRISPFASTPQAGKEVSPFSLWAVHGDGKIHHLFETGTHPRRRVTKGDIIHIIVDETSAASITADTDLKRRFELDAQLKDWIRFNGISQLVPAARDSQPGIDFRSERRLQGNGRRNRRDRMLFRIAAMIVEDLGDGTLFVAARKTKRVHDEESILTLSGYIRREDIDEKRTVRSESIHSLNLSYTGSGSLTSNYTRSIWGWLLDLVWF